MLTEAQNRKSLELGWRCTSNNEGEGKQIEREAFRDNVLFQSRVQFGSNQY